MANDRTITLTIAAAAFGSNVTGFPWLLTRASFGANGDELFDPSGSNATRTDGGDVRCFQSSSEIPREVVSWEHDSATSAEDADCEAWALIDGDSATGASLEIQYGDGALTEPAVGDTYGRNAVWSGYLNVWHLHDGTALSYVDSAGNEADGSVYAGTPTTETVAFGTGLSMTSDCGVWLGSDGSFVGGSNSSIEISAWLSPDDNTVGRPIGHINGYRASTGNTVRVDVAGAESGRPHFSFQANNSFDGIWVDASWVDGDAVLYAAQWDGVSETLDQFAQFSTSVGQETASAARTSETLSGGNRALYLGGPYSGLYGYRGGIKEVRTTTTLHSANWIAAEYVNQNNPAANVTPGAPSAISGSTDALLADNISSSTSVGSPSIGQNHALSASDVASASSVTTPAIGQVHALSASDISASPSVGAPTLAEGTHALAADDIAATPSVGAPAIGQVHALSAADVASATSVSTPTLTEGQHVLLADDIAAAPSVGAPSLGQVHTLLAGDIVVTTSVGTPALGAPGATTAPGLEFTVERGPMHYTVEREPAHYTVPARRLHYTG